MNKFIGVAANLAAVFGVLLCALTGAARIIGIYAIGSVGTMPLFTVGIGVMVFACLAKIHLMAVRMKSD